MSQSLRGHPIEHDGDQWRFVDTGEATVTAWAKRPCGHCGLRNTADGHDGCLGTLPGVTNACCGHGNETDAYVQFDDGRRLSGPDAMSWIEAAITTP